MASASNLGLVSSLRVNPHNSRLSLVLSNFSKVRPLCVKGKAQQAMEKVEEQLKSVQESLQKEKELTDKLEKEAKKLLEEKEEMSKELEKSSSRGQEVQQRLNNLSSAKVG